MPNPRIPFQLATRRQGLPAPDGKPLIVQIVVALELFAFDQPVPRKLLPNPHGAGPVPDIANWSWIEYGLRCGLPRLARILNERSIPAVACINSDLIDAYPEVAEVCLEAGWEFQGHGTQQKAIAEDEEQQVIGRALERIKAFTGKPVRGWIGPGIRESPRTPELLRSAGIDYVSDWGMIDDLPVWMRTDAGPLVVVPYTLELNDTYIFHVAMHGPAEQDLRMRDMVAGLEPELRKAPRVLTLSFHTYLMGQAHRAHHAARALDYLLARDDTKFMSGAQICDWFLETDTAKAERPT
ncbi:MAG TPA: polysaccharide deacetylase family protein [Burkholderiales bacterium]|nr:polysaccharide deacetylase family protein [Burkholderiales bacterium]